MPLNTLDHPLVQVTGAAATQACAVAAANAKYLSIRHIGMHFDSAIIDCYVDDPDQPSCGIFLERQTDLILPWSQTTVRQPLQAWLHSHQALAEFQVCYIAPGEEEAVDSLLRDAGYTVESEHYVEVHGELADINETPPWLPEFEVGQLRIEDAERIDTVWHYRTERTIELIRHLILNRPTLTLRRRRDNTLIAWILVQADYSMGMAHVLPEYRGLGIMPWLHAKLGNEHIRLGFACFGYIHSENAAMLRAAPQAGMQVLTSCSCLSAQRARDPRASI